MAYIDQNNASTPQQTPDDSKVIQDIKLRKPVDFTFMGLRSLSSQFNIDDREQ